MMVFPFYPFFLICVLTLASAIFGNITEVYTNTALMMKSIFVCVRTNPSCFPSLLPDNEEWIIPTYSVCKKEITNKGYTNGEKT